MTGKIVVGLLWHSLSSDNLGVGALTASQVAVCRAAAESAGVTLEFKVFGFIGHKSYGHEIAGITSETRVSLRQILKGKSEFLREAALCDVILDIGEGDSFSDIYGINRFAFLALSKLAIIAKCKPLVLSPQTIGPFDKWWSRIAAKQLMKRCNMVYARDGISRNYLDSQGLKNVDEAIDVAFRLPFQRVDLGPTKKIRVGINVSGLLFAGGYDHGNQFGLTVDYKKHIDDLLGNLLQRDDIEVWLVPHVLSETIQNEDDRHAIAKIAEKHSSVKIAPDFNSPSEAKSFIAAMDFFTGARMHACIAAFSSGVPVVPFAYSRKFNGLFSSLQYEYVADGRSLTTEEATAQVVVGLEKISSLKAAVEKGNLIAKVKLKKYEEYLAHLFLLESQKS